ncbi:hypothetical protein [Ornithinibacillus sp. JPR2-1]|uniref:hypothetical protein n=1 Tax=Ornithinibacillus sp. JPR2-1 TaxID=2094019 RepID=UPI0031DCF5EC
MKYNPNNNYMFVDTTVLLDGDVLQLMYVYRNFMIFKVDEDHISFLPVEEGELDPLFADKGSVIYEDRMTEKEKTHVDLILKGHENDYKVNGIVYPG